MLLNLLGVLFHGFELVCLPIDFQFRRGREQQGFFGGYAPWRARRRCPSFLEGFRDVGSFPFRILDLLAPLSIQGKHVDVDLRLENTDLLVDFAPV